MADSSKTQNIRISYVSPGARPPIYIAGSFTDPPWQPEELDYVLEQPGDMDSGTPSECSLYRFVKSVQIGEGRWQYKFRLGLGDWWVCDEHTEKITDGLGNENNVVTVDALQFPSRGPDNVPSDGTFGAENHQSTQMQERVTEKEVADQKTQLETGGPPLDRKSDYNVDTKKVEELDTRSKSQKNKCSPLSPGQFTLDNEISGNPDSKAKHANGLNDDQEIYQEKKLSPFEDKLIVKVEDTESQPLIAQGGADQEGSRRRRIGGKLFSTSSLEISDNTKPSTAGFGSFWKWLLDWLDSLFGRLFEPRRP
ncbi:hypothetical protein MMC07_004113 [Pseudocyphellaria aurata]|nr:hypothetical protein [Pseudocyphellaria aurata]